MSLLAARFVTEEHEVECETLREPRALRYCPPRSNVGEYESDLDKDWYERHQEMIASESEGEERGK